ncbi:MAG: DUF362 domain-containing protein [candidate division WOR-3 bacterium]
MSEVFVLKTNPNKILEDYEKLLHLANYQEFLKKDKEIIIKLNLSWTLFYPASSSPPWQLEGVVRTLLKDGYEKEKIYPCENKTVVTDVRKGAKNQGWLKVLKKYGLKFYPLPEEEWIKYDFKGPLLKLDKIFKEGIYIPKIFINKNVIHLPTMKTHGHSITTGAIKNAFGGLLKEVRHYGHEFIHEVLVDLLIMQKEIHPVIFAVMDGTVCGNGAGPRTMLPYIGNLILASFDSVALDAVAAKIMGFEPLKIDYLRIAHDLGLGCADLEKIKIYGEDISSLNFKFKTKKSLVIFGDQQLRKGYLRFLKRIALHSPLWIWAPIASTFYHDFLWYPFIGKNRLKRFLESEWGRLFKKYLKEDKNERRNKEKY